MQIPKLNSINTHTLPGTQWMQESVVHVSVDAPDGGGGWQAVVGAARAKVSLFNHRQSVL